MLTVYRRHNAPCKFAGYKEPRRYRNCQCPIWVQGSLRGEYIKKALDLRSWEAASDLVRGWEASGEIGVVKVEIPTVREAVAKFMEYQKSRNLSAETIRKYENLLDRRFMPWCEKKGYTRFKQLTVDALRSFQTTWKDGATYATKNLERMRAFFEFALEAQWIERNPVNSLKRPKATDAPTLPFTDEEMTRILDACDRYRGDKDRIRAFVLTMRYSGLRIGDTIALDKSRLTGNKLFLYTAKTGTPVYVPLPPVVTEALAKLDTNGNGRYFSTGNAKPQTARANWSRYLDSIFESAKVEDGHSHRFRDTFAVGLLAKGVSLENLSVLLGHSSVKITEKHYKPWVKTLQAQLETDVAKAWE
jgi:site-specific recombinase XerD